MLSKVCHWLHCKAEQKWEGKLFLRAKRNLKDFLPLPVIAIFRRGFCVKGGKNRNSRHVLFIEDKLYKMKKDYN